MDRQTGIGPAKLPGGILPAIPSLQRLRANDPNRFLHMFDLLPGNVIGLDGGHDSGDLLGDALH